MRRERPVRGSWRPLGQSYNGSEVQSPSAAVPVQQGLLPQEIQVWERCGHSRLRKARMKEERRACLVPESLHPWLPKEVLHLEVSGGQ